VASQTWNDIEHIVIDGGSTDNTLQIIKEEAERNPNLRWISAQDNGISDAMNKGLAMATGEVISFLHADDYFADSSMLERVARIFVSHPAVEWLTGGIHHVDKGGHVLKSFSVRRWSYRRLVRGNILFHPSTFVRRHVFEATGGFNTDLRYAMDYDLWLRLGNRSAPYQLHQPLACFRLHSGSLSVSQVDGAFCEELKVRLRHLQGKPLQQALHLFYFSLKFLPNRLNARC
jgi:glycosyltransferase involved in cell wall biosynthesis